MIYPTMGVESMLDLWKWTRKQWAEKSLRSTDV